MVSQSCAKDPGCFQNCRSVAEVLSSVAESSDAAHPKSTQYDPSNTRASEPWTAPRPQALELLREGIHMSDVIKVRSRSQPCQSQAQRKLLFSAVGPFW